MECGSAWPDRCGYDGKWQDVVHESLIVLKALTYAPTGGIVAAPTTSLPERVGGERNWDYRYCWLRDATLVLLAFLNAGYLEEARAWRTWLLRAAAGDPADLQTMYGVAGERRLTEIILDWLPGYEGSTPVRIGNAATGQFQLDVYGEVLDALHQGRVHELEVSIEARRRKPADHPARRLSACRRPAHGRYGRGDRARSRPGRPRLPLHAGRGIAQRRRAAARRGCISALHLLARRQLRAAGATQRR